MLTYVAVKAVKVFFAWDFVRTPNFTLTLEPKLVLKFFNRFRCLFHLSMKRQIYLFLIVLKFYLECPTIKSELDQFSVLIEIKVKMYFE